MKILYVVNSLAGSGGLEKILLDKANAFVNCFHWDIGFLCGTKKNFPPCNNKKFELFSFSDEEYSSRIPSLRRFFKYANVLKKFNPDVVIICNNKLEDFLYPFVTPKRMKVLKEIHGSYQSVVFGYPYLMNGSKQRLWWLYKYLYPLLLSSFAKTIFLTEKDKFLWNVKNACVIGNFSNLTKNKCNASDLYLQWRAISVGRLEPNKGMVDLIKLWQVVKQKIGNLRLDIYGIGKQKNELELLIRQYQIEDLVSLKGYSTNIIDEYNSSTVFVSASYSEGFPLVILESQICGLPSVVYNAPNGFSELIKPGYNGEIVERGNVTQFVDSLKKVLSSLDVYRSYSENAVRHSTKFSKDAIILKWHSLLTSLVKNEK